jgi:aspartate aminotransferase
MLSLRIQELSPSPTLSLNAKVKELQSQGRPVLNLTAGEPDFEPPETLKQAAIQAIWAKCHHYTPVPGLLQLRAAVADKYRRNNEIDYQTDEIIVSTGAKQVLHNALLALVEPGDEVLIHTPTWSTYVEQIKLAGGQVKTVALEPPFQLTAEQVQAQITERTKVLILNYPGNPTGAVIELEELQKIADLVVKHDLWLISDEIYEKILFEGRQHTSIASLGKEVKQRTLTVGGLSKSHAVTGWRLGWGAGPKELIDGMANLQGQTTSGASSIVQQAAISALEEKDSITHMVQSFQERRDFLVSELSQIEGLEITEPEGAFYLFVGIQKLLNEKYPTSLDWCEGLLEHQQIAVVPGEAFLAPGYFRLSFAADMDSLEKAGVGFRQFILP